MDITHWQLASGAGAEILNIIDGHSRFLIASAARRAYRAAAELSKGRTSHRRRSAAHQRQILSSCAS
jgi:hypothetical protein